MNVIIPNQIDVLPPERSITLIGLAAEIRQAHQDVQRAFDLAAQRAIDAGRMLIAARDRDDMPFGGYERWVRDAVGVPLRTARRYVQLFNAVEEGSATWPDIAKAGMIAALRAASSREARRRDKPELIAAPGQAQLFLRDVAELADCEADSVDWIITDPPYPREFLPVYDHLARGAARALKPGAALLCMVGQSWLPEVMAALGAHLRYHWTLAYLTPGGQAVQVFPRSVNAFWKPVLMFSKGDYAGDWFGDVSSSAVNDNDKEHHHWGQSETGMLDLMRRFVRPGETVLDPFLGGGTTALVSIELGARFIGWDIDSDAIAATRRRIGT